MGFNTRQGTFFNERSLKLLYFYCCDENLHIKKVMLEFSVSKDVCLHRPDAFSEGLCIGII